MKVWIVTWDYKDSNAEGTAYRAFSTHGKALKFVIKEASSRLDYDWKNASERARRNGESEYACAQLGAVVFDLPVDSLKK